MTTFQKYPRTPHLSFSLGRTSDDKTLKSHSHFEGKEVVVMEKMDGENLTYYENGYHARSLDGRDHWSRSYAKKKQAELSKDIPSGWRFCGENCYATHSIKYDNLEDYILFFSIWDNRNICLDWDTTLQYFELLDLKYPKILYRGMWDEKKLQEIAESLDTYQIEGYVVRLADEFNYNDFSKSVAKFVRKNHVQSDEHWFYNSTETNKLK